MFWFRDTVEGDVRVDVAFTDSTIYLQGLRPGFEVELPRLVGACGVRFARLNQMHGDDVLVVDAPGPGPLEELPSGDALVTATRGVGLMVRAADCVPVLLADPRAGVVGAVHSGRQGTSLDIAARTITWMRDLGAEQIRAWVGPRVCGGCYEVPDQMRADVAAVVPAAYAETTWGTPSLDLGAGVVAQLAAAGAEVIDVGGCTREEPRLHSHRRDGALAGRLAGVVWAT
ncbi:MAG: polyphenol oxidase family protein [Nocardioides sp.]